MRIPAMLVASAHLCLAACQTAPGSLLPMLSPPDASAAAKPGQKTAEKTDKKADKKADQQPYMRCVTDFWGNCTGVVSNRHAYRWRYVRPGARPRELRESPVARENILKASLRQEDTVRKQDTASKQDPVRQKAPTRQQDTASKQDPVRQKAPTRQQAAAPKSAPNRRTAVVIRDRTVACHARRRVVGDERPSRDDARRAAEYGWMGAVRYDHGERYQEISHAKDVRLSCGPSSISTALKTPYFRCAIEGTPCRETEGVPREPEQREQREPPRFDPAQEPQISRR